MKKKLANEVKWRGRSRVSARRHILKIYAQIFFNNRVLKYRRGDKSLRTANQQNGNSFQTFFLLPLLGWFFSGAREKFLCGRRMREASVTVFDLKVAAMNFHCCLGETIADFLCFLLSPTAHDMLCSRDKKEINWPHFHYCERNVFNLRFELL